MTLTADIRAERAALTDSLSAAGASVQTGCGSWTAQDLAAHLVAEERIAGVSTFIARSLVIRGIAVPAPPKMVDFGMRREHRLGFNGLIQRLRRPVPPLLLRPRVAPLTLFEYWTHHDDLIGPATHAVPPTLAQAIPPLLRYQLKKLPAGIRVAAGTNGRVHAVVGPESSPTTAVEGTPANLVRWLAGRPADISVSGPASHVQTLRTFDGHV